MARLRILASCHHSGRGSSRSSAGCRSRRATSAAKTVRSAPGTMSADEGVLAARLSRHLRDRPAQPGPADPLRDPQRARRRRRRAGLRPVDRPRGASCAPHGCPLFSVDTHRAGRRVRRAGLQPVRRAGLHERPQLHRPGRRAGARRRAPARASAGRAPAGTAPTTPSRSPTSSTSSCSARARRSSPRSPRSSRDWKASGRTEARATGCCASWPRCRACTCPSMYEVDLRRRRPGGGHAPLRRRARRRSTSARSPTSPTGRTRSVSSCRSPRSSTTASTSRCSAAAPAAAASARPG